MTTEHHAAYLKLCRENERFIRWVARRCMHGREADAEDVIQDALLSGLRTYDPNRIGHFRNWMQMIVKHRAQDFLKRRKELARNKRSTKTVQFVEYEEGHEGPDSGPSPRDAIERRQFMEALEAALATMPERDVRIFRTYAQEGMTVAEVAEALNMKPCRTWQLKDRCAKGLAERLRDYDDTGRTPGKGSAPKR